MIQPIANFTGMKYLICDGLPRGTFILLSWPEYMAMASPDRRGDLVEMMLDAEAQALNG